MARGLSIFAFILSLLFFIPLIPILGLILGIIAYRKAVMPEDLKTLALISIIMGGLFGFINLMVSLGFLITMMRLS